MQEVLLIENLAFDNIKISDLQGQTLCPSQYFVLTTRASMLRLMIVRVSASRFR